MCALLLTACGTALGPVTISASTTINSARAHRAAMAINLTAADLPTYRLVAGQNAWSPQAGSIGPCLGTATPIAVGTSAQYTNDSGLSGGQVSSLTSTFNSNAGAREMLNELRSQRAAQCLQESARTYLTPASQLSDLKLEPSAQITVLPITVTGAPHTFAYRIALTAQPKSVSQQQLSIYVDLLGFTTGPALTELVTITTGQLEAATTEQDLINLLARRARSSVGTLPS